MFAFWKQYCFYLWCFTLLGAQQIKGLQLNLYNNTALYGVPNESYVINTTNYTIYSEFHLPISTTIMGTLLMEKSVEMYYFKCIWDSYLYGFLWLDDHLICAHGVYSQPSIISWNISQTKTANTNSSNIRNVFFRLDLYSNTTINDGYHFEILWSFNNNDSFKIIDSSHLNSNIPSYQLKRFEIQNDILNNYSWNFWVSTNLLTIIKMPDSFGITIGICRYITDAKYDCIMRSVVQTNIDLQVGMHSIDNSYIEYNLTFNNLLLKYELATDIENDKSFYVSLHPNFLNSSNDEQYYVAVNVDFYWRRIGNYTILNREQNDFYNIFNVKASGFNKAYSILSNKAAINDKYILVNESWNVLLFPIDDITKPLYFTTNNEIKSASHISTIIEYYRNKEIAFLMNYGYLNETKLAIQSVLMNNMIYSPEEGPFGLISRGPGWIGPFHFGYPEFGFVLFDWDNIFGSYLYHGLSLLNDTNSIYYRNIAANYSFLTLISIIKAQTFNGFIPNYKWVKGSSLGPLTTLGDSQDRTEPPIGTYTLYQLYEYFHIKLNIDTQWLLDFLFDELYDWSTWFWNNRRCEPYKLICLGSSPSSAQSGYYPEETWEPNHNTKGAASDESGLDNSPMWDNATYDNDTLHRLLIYDVGMTSLVINEIKYLIKIANILNKSNQIINILENRLIFYVNAFNKYLWNDEYKFYSNQLIINNQTQIIPNVRITPTYFYPLLNHKELNLTLNQIEYIIETYLLSPNYFCINIDFPNNQSDDCYWGLPSISKNDPVYQQQGYWRGYTWGPMAQLTYWSLNECYKIYGNSIIIENGMKALSNQMRLMMMDQWYLHHHICENFSPIINHTDCTGDQFYYWGALTGYLSLQQEYK